MKREKKEIVLQEEKEEIIKHFESGRERMEKIAWGKTLHELSHDDLLLLWYGVSFSHLLMKDETLSSLFRSRIRDLGGFKTLPFSPSREESKNV